MKITDIIIEAGEPNSPSRRGFLKSIGAVAASAATPSSVKDLAKTAIAPVASAAAPAAATGQSMASILMQPLIPKLYAVSTAVDSDDAGEKWDRTMNYSSHDDGFGTLPNGDTYFLETSPSGIPYMVVYDLNEEGGSRQLVYLDPQTKKPIDIGSSVNLGQNPEDSTIDIYGLGFEFDPEKLPPEIEESYERDNAVRITDNGQFIDAVVQSGGIKKYMEKLKSQTEINSNDNNGDQDLDIQNTDDLAKSAGSQMAKSIARSSAAGAIRTWLNKVKSADQPTTNTVKDMGWVDEVEPKSNKTPALPAPSEPNVITPNIKTKKQHVTVNKDNPSTDNSRRQNK